MDDCVHARPRLSAAILTLRVLVAIAFALAPSATTLLPVLAIPAVAANAEETENTGSEREGSGSELNELSAEAIPHRHHRHTVDSGNAAADDWRSVSVSFASTSQAVPAPVRADPFRNGLGTPFRC